MKIIRNDYHLSFILGSFFGLCLVLTFGYLLIPITLQERILSQLNGFQATGTTSPIYESRSQVLAENTFFKNRHEYGIAAGGGLVSLNQTLLEQYFKKLSQTGVKWVRWDLDWSTIQPNGPNEFRWADSDRVAEMAKKYGINSLGIITYAPKWAGTPGCDEKSKCSPRSAKEFALFSGQVAARYGNLIKYWEIWNEPNYSFFFSPRAGTREYFELIKEAYPAIKKADPKAFVLSGGLAPVADKGDGSIAPFNFLSKVYELGGQNYFDAVAIHPYTYPVLPDYHTDWNQWLEMDKIRLVMLAHGDMQKQIWITEFGAPTNGPGRDYLNNQTEGFKYGADFMNESAQAELFMRANKLYLQSDWLGMFFWYTLIDNSDKRDDPENFFGLIGANGTKKAAYYEFKNAVSHK